VIGWLYEKMTGRPWVTVRSATAEFGPPPGAAYRRELAVFTDAELYQYGDQIVAALRARDRRRRQAAARLQRVA
jgi:hypothetical protein